MEWRDFISMALTSIMEEYIPKAKKAWLNAPPFQRHRVPICRPFQARVGYARTIQMFSVIGQEAMSCNVRVKTMDEAKHLFIFSSLCHNCGIGHSDA
jgi:hypothetical protein